MTLAAAKAPASTIGAVIAVAVGVTWALVSARDIANIADWVGVMSFSAALAMLAAAAWLVTNLTGRSKSVVAAAAILGIGGIVAAIGNFIEDGLGVKALGAMYELGIFGVLVGLLALVVALALQRHVLVAALAVATLAGLLMSMEAGGGFLILGCWLVVAAILRRGWARPSESALPSGQLRSR